MEISVFWRKLFPNGFKLFLFLFLESMPSLTKCEKVEEFIRAEILYTLGKLIQGAATSKIFCLRLW